MSIISNIIRNATKTNEPLNIIVAPYDGLFEYSLCQVTPHKYYMLSNTQKLAQTFVKSNRLFHLDSNINNWNLSLDFDLIICNEITTQIDLCTQLSKMLHIPLLIIHHSLKPDFVKKEDIQILRDRHYNDTVVVTHDLINESWYGKFPVMSYCTTIDDAHLENKALIAGTFNPQQLFFLQELKQKIRIPLTIVGNNPGISEQILFEECLKLIKSHRIFLNLYNDSEINALMLYAMSAGCTVISTPSKITEALIKHNVNGYITPDIENILKLSLSSNENIGKEAQKTIAEYNKQDFGISWNNLLTTTSKKPFLG